MRRVRFALVIVVAALLAAVPAAAPDAPTAGAAPWQPAGITGGPVHLLAVDASAPGVVYAVAAGGPARPRGSLIKTVDGGRTWFSLERGVPAGFQPAAIAVSPDGGHLVLAAGGDGLFRSTAAGALWTEVRVPLPPVTALLIDQADPRTVLAGTELRGNFRSLDGGLTWQPSSRGLPRDHYGNLAGAVRFVQHPTSPQTVYMASNGFDGVYRSTDGGVSWQPARDGLPSTSVLTLGINPASPETLYALTSRGLSKSDDGGGTWTAVDSLPPITPVALAFEPGAKDTLYVAGERGALVRSTNGGVSWVDLAPLPRPVRALASWPTLAGATLAAAAGDGVWQLALWPTLPASPQPPARDREYFPQTGHNVSPTFQRYFRAFGGPDRFGFPRTEELLEDGLLVQYFQRARLEHHPERRGTPYEVQISLIGEWLLGPERAPRAEPFESSTEQRYFEETGHSVNYAFLRYFTTRAGLDSLGYPVSEELLENGWPVQYFQRARLEYHVENAGTRDEVVLGLIGDEVLRHRGWLD